MLVGTVLYDYFGDKRGEDNEVDIKQGDVVEILEMYDDGWWLVKIKQPLGTTCGIAPSNYIKLHTMEAEIVDLKPEGLMNNRVLGADEDGNILPANWKSSIDAETNDKYYYNESNGIVQWEHPAVQPELCKTKKLNHSRIEAPLKQLSSLTKVTQKSNLSFDTEFPSNYFTTDRNEKQQNDSFHGSLQSQDLERLRQLREQAEEKINALRVAVSSNESNLAIKKSNSQDVIAVTKNETASTSDRARDEVNNLMLPPLQKQGQGSNKKSVPKFEIGKAQLPLPKVELDPKSLSFISQLIKERIEKEFLQRDEQLLGKVQNLLLQQSGSNSPTLYSSKQSINLPGLTKEGKDGGQQMDAVTLPTLCSASKQKSPNLQPNPILQSSRVKGPKGGVRYANCRSVVYSPTAAHDSDALSADLKLHHVFGYDGDVERHGNSCKGRNTLIIERLKVASSDGTEAEQELEVVFPAAAVVVLMNLKSCKQRFFNSHSDDVTCIAIHPDMVCGLAASGQKGHDGGLVFVWNFIFDEVSLVSTLPLPESHSLSRGISSISFCPGTSNYLVAMAMDEAHSLFLFDYNQAILLLSVKTGQVDAQQVTFNHVLYSGGSYEEGSCHTLATFGGKSIKFWCLLTEKKKNASNDSAPYLDEGGSFRGRKLKPKLHGKNSTNNISHYTLDGSVGILPRNSSYDAALCITVCCDPPDPLSGRPRSRIFSGATNGSILIWEQIEDTKNNSTGWRWSGKGRLLSVVMEAHESSILSMDVLSFSKGTLISSGSSDGVVSLWKIKDFSRVDNDGSSLPIEHIFSIELPEGVRSISWQRDSNDGFNQYQAVLGTLGNNIQLLTYSEGLEKIPSVSLHLLQSGHVGKVKCVAVHPVFSSIFVSVSADGSIRLWDGSNRNEKSQLSNCLFNDLVSLGKKEKKQTRVISGASFSADGRVLAIGDESGYVSLLEGPWTDYADESKNFLSAHKVDDLLRWKLLFDCNIAHNLQHQATSPSPRGKIDFVPSKLNAAIVALKFCHAAPMSEGGILAVSSRDNLIHLLEVLMINKKVSIRRRCFCRGHTAPVQSLDFSLDGTYLMAADNSKELLFWQVETGSRVNAVALRDEVWYSWSSTLGWPVMGAANLPQNAEIGNGLRFGDINCAIRSPDKTLLAVGSSQRQAIRLFPYPCLNDSIPKAYNGHSSPVVDIVFLQDSSNLSLSVVSAGGNDCCLFQWKVLPKERN